MKNNNLRRIKIETRDKVRGFYTLITNGSSTVCLPDNEYIVPENALGELKKEKIKFNEIENGSKVKSTVSGTPKI